MICSRSRRAFSISSRNAGWSNGAQAAATRWAEPRLTRTVALSASEPATVATGVDLLVPAGTVAVAPWDLEVLDSDGRLVAVSPAGRLVLDGLEGAPAAFNGPRKLPASPLLPQVWTLRPGR